MDDSVTISIDDATPGSSRKRRERWALVVVWSDEPERLGEVLLATQSWCVFGRGGPRPEDGRPRVGLWRMRPGVREPAAPVRSRVLSRRQLAVVERADGLALECIGRAALQVDGRPVGRAEVTDGDLVQLGPWMFLCMRISEDPPNEPAAPLHNFGMPDEHGIVGESEGIWELRRRIALLRGRRQHVLVRGETGTGKELVAGALHTSGRWVARNAATLPEGLVDAELFGNVAGYPNPGMLERPGLIGAAHGGTLFLDEIAELPETLQAHLLRVLDTGEYQRLGDASVRRSDLCVVAATNRPDNAFKHDLLARFPLRVSVPPLRDRPTDVPMLVLHLLRGIVDQAPDFRERFFDGPLPRMAPNFLRSLLSHDHPENVRGLRAALWSSLLESEGDLLECPATWIASAPASWTTYAGLASNEIPPAAIQAALDAHNGNQGRTWRALKLDSRHVLARLIRKHGLVVRRR